MAGFCNKKILLLFLRNIVSTVNLACKLDLKNIALHARNAEYNPKVNRGLRALPSLPSVLMDPNGPGTVVLTPLLLGGWKITLGW